MSNLFRHTLEVWRGSPGALDPEGADYGRRVRTPTLIGTFYGAVHQQRVRELPDPAGIGPSIATHRIFLEPAAASVVAKGDTIRKVSGTPVVDAELNGDYHVEGDPNVFGGHHVQVDATRTEA